MSYLPSSTAGVADEALALEDREDVGVVVDRAEPRFSSMGLIGGNSSFFSSFLACARASRWRARGA